MTQLVPVSDLATPTYNLSWLGQDATQYPNLFNSINKGEPFWTGGGASSVFIHGSKNKLGFHFTFSGTVTTAQLRICLATSWFPAGQLEISAVRLFNQSMTEIMNWTGDFAIDDQTGLPQILDIRFAGAGGAVTGLNVTIDFVAGTSSGPIIYGMNLYINEYCYGYDGTYGISRTLPVGDVSNTGSWTSTAGNFYTQVAKNIPGASTGTYIELTAASGGGPYYGYHIKFNLGDLNFIPRLCTVRLFCKVTGGTATVRAFDISQGFTPSVFQSQAAATISTSNGEVALPMHTSSSPLGKKEWGLDLYFVCQPSVVVRIYAVQVDFGNEENEEFLNSGQLKTLRDPTDTVSATETNCGNGIMFSYWHSNADCVVLASFEPTGLIRLSIPIAQGTPIKSAVITLTAIQSLNYYGYLWCFKDATADAQWPSSQGDFDTLMTFPHGYLGGDHNFLATGNHTFNVDITDSVQAAVNQPGWVSGNHIILVFEALQEAHGFTINQNTVALSIDIPKNNGRGTPSTMQDYVISGLATCYLGSVTYTDLYRIICQFYVNQFQGSTVDRAYLNVYSENGYSPMTIRVRGVKKEDCYWPGPGGSGPGDPTMALALFSNLTTEYVDVSASGAGQMLQFDVTSIVQEILNQQGWMYENQVIFAIETMTGADDSSTYVVLDNYQGLSGPHLRIWAHGGNDRSQISQDAGNYLLTSAIPSTLQDWANNGLDNLDLGYIDGTHQYQGLVWVPLICPQGHLIDSAFLFLMLSSGSLSFTIQAVAQDNPSWPANATAADALPLGSQSVTYYNYGYSQPQITEIDITTVIQEFVNRPGFVFGNYLLLKIIYVAAGGNHRSFRTKGTESLGPFVVLNLNTPIPGSLAGNKGAMMLMLMAGNKGAMMLMLMAEKRKLLFFN